MQIAVGSDKNTVQHNYLAYMYIETIKTNTDWGIRVCVESQHLFLSKLLVFTLKKNLSK